ncbi:MAG: ThuA domain-containing protein [Phycisphaerales bacterium]
MKWTGARVCVLVVVMVISMSSLLMGQQRQERPWVVYRGGGGPGQGKTIVFVTGDEEYRSEESMPMMAKILATHHGFRCIVLFAINKDTGEIDPLTVDNIAGLRNLERADLMVLFTRFRELPDEQMKYIMDYTNSGKPIIALRTATHPFFYQKNKESPYAKWSWQNKEPGFEGGYGRQVLGETWISHYGDHQKESTLAYPAEGMENCPILKGVDKVWGPSDVYGLTTLNGDCKPVLMGQPLSGMNPTDAPNTNKKPLPVAWTKTYTGESGKAAKVFTTTMGHAGDLKDENFRRVLVNACYWALDMEAQIPAKSDVTIIGEYNPNDIGFGGFKKGLKPADHRLSR